MNDKSQSGLARFFKSAAFIEPNEMRAVVLSMTFFFLDVTTCTAHHEPSRLDVTGSQSVALQVNNSTTAWEVTHGP